MSNWQADLKTAVRLVVERTADGEPLWLGVYHLDPIITAYRLFKQDRLALRGSWRFFSRDTCSHWPRSQETLFTLKVASLLAQRYPDRGLIVKPVIYVRSRPELEPFLDARSPVAARRKHNKIMRGRNP